MRSIVSTFMELVGLAAVVGGAFLANPLLGVGVVLVIAGVLVGDE